jgi:hypothetical protein
MSRTDEEPTHVGTASTGAILSLLDKHAYQLANDGWIQFGLVEDWGDLTTEVFVTTTKHFVVWFNNEQLFRSILRNHDVSEVEHLEFLDEYPRTTIRLPEDRVSFYEQSDLIEHLRKQIGQLSSF